jgi:hypothetical protein
MLPDAPQARATPALAVHSTTRGLMDPAVPRKSQRGFVVFCLILLAFGIYLFPKGVQAFRTGMPVRGLSMSKHYDWLEVLSLSIGSILVGAGGIWATIRERRR